MAQRNQSHQCLPLAGQKNFKGWESFFYLYSKLPFLYECNYLLACVKYLFLCPWWIFLSNRMCGVLLCFQQGQRWSWYIFLGLDLKWSKLNLSCSLPSSMDYLWRWATNQHIVSTFFKKIPHSCYKNLILLDLDSIKIELSVGSPGETSHDRWVWELMHNGT